MDRLLIIADDFTGALDTGIQFTKLGINTKILTDSSYDFFSLPSDIQVIVIDAETRPMTGKDAYEKVYEITSRACRAGIVNVYKKTDSALRGNIGSELEAVMDASGQKSVCLIPALPRENRITIGGIHYINKIPVCESMFGRDPFEPVPYSGVSQIIGQQSSVIVRNVSVKEYHSVNLDTDDKTVFVFDAESEAHMREIADVLKRQGKHSLCSGCAGFAAYYPRMISFQKGYTREPVKTEGLLCLCGSVNPITKKQLDYAREHGFGRENLKCFQKLEAKYLESEEGKEFLNQIYERIAGTKGYIVDTLDTAGFETVEEYSSGHHLSEEQIRRRITDTLGKIGKEMAKRGLNYTISMTGGDTLMGFMRLMGCSELEPVCEIGKGAVLSILNRQGGRLQVISKSGGFGDENIFLEMLETVV